MKSRRKNRRSRNRSTISIAHGKRNIFISYDFSDIEDDTNAFNIIQGLANFAGKNAAAEAKAAGLARVYINDNKDLVRVSPGGEEVIIKPKSKRSFYYISYKPSTVLHAIKK